MLVFECAVASIRSFALECMSPTARSLAARIARLIETQTREREVSTTAVNVLIEVQDAAYLYATLLLRVITW